MELAGDLVDSITGIGENNAIDYRIRILSGLRGRLLALSSRKPGDLWFIRK
jgi:hypothetical protein